LAVSTACFLQKRKDPQLGTSSEKQNFCITWLSKKISAGTLQHHLEKLFIWASNIWK
jgi:hypothetical protein